MVAYFASIGARTGIYSTGIQWDQIAGMVPSTSSLYSMSSWIAGASTLAAAEANCFSAPLTGGGKVVLTQYTSGGAPRRQIQQAPARVQAEQLLTAQSVIASRIPEIASRTNSSKQVVLTSAPSLSDPARTVTATTGFTKV